MTIRFFGPLLCAGLLAAALLIPGPASAAPVNFSCSPAKMKGSASALDNSATTSPTFVNIPEAHVGFVQGAGGGCVVVTFSAIIGELSTVVIVRAQLDGTTLALPAEAEFIATSGTFAFVFPSVAAGAHTVQMQFRSANSPNWAIVASHNTIVQYTP